MQVAVISTKEPVTVELMGRKIQNTLPRLQKNSLYYCSAVNRSLGNQPYVINITKSCLPTVKAQSLLDNESSRTDDNNFWKNKFKMLKISK